MKLLCSNLFIFFIFYFATAEPSPHLHSHNLAKPGCSSQCGELIVPYPFGIGTSCSMNVGFTIYCNISAKPTRAYLSEDRSSITIKLLSDSTIHFANEVITACYDEVDRLFIESAKLEYDFLNTPLTFSKVNSLILIGCPYYAMLSSSTIYEDMLIGCPTSCSKKGEFVVGECKGNGCCQSAWSRLVKQITIDIRQIGNRSKLGQTQSFSPCGHAFVGDKSYFTFKGIEDLTDSASLVRRIKDTVPVVFDWAIGILSCPEVKRTHAFVCHAHSSCVNSTNSGYRCICDKGYEGNPYLSPGCQDVNECKHLKEYPCYGTCFNTIGSYKCTCLEGFFGDAHKINGCQHSYESKILLHSYHSKTLLNIHIIIGLVLVILALACGMGSYCVIRRRKLARLRETFFEANGGMLLKQKMSSQECHEAMTLFTQRQLIKATNNYSQKYIIGTGAHGIIYKGVLSDRRFVAIKKSKLVDGTQVEQFINEMLIVTQIIHRHVVKLLGCCLEEEVPILVYEYIPNNTLFHHMHHTTGGMTWLSWEHRLRIAAEVASAIAYLHFETITPILHRDIKSSNILLDLNYTAKVSDFGISKLVPLDHEHVTTLIRGTLGYVDPEYFHTSQLTQKSDVYSFGVVLAELMTNKKHIDIDREDQEKFLATYFVNSLKEHRLNTIVEPRILNEGSLEQLLAVGDLVKRCLNLEGHNRPTMKEIIVELDGLRNLTASNKTTNHVTEVELDDNL